jgi:hypothetical protein
MGMDRHLPKECGAATRRELPESHDIQTKGPHVGLRDERELLSIAINEKEQKILH